MLLHRLKIEGLRIFRCKKNLTFLIIFIIICGFFVFSGISEYKRFAKRKEYFLTHEQTKVKLYVTYSHYGDYGFRVLFEPPVLSIFFSNSSVFENLNSNVDMTEILDVNRSYKGRDLLLKKGFFKDLAGMFFMFGSLFMIYMGTTSYKSEKYFFRFGNTILRMVILNLIVILLLLVFFHFPNVFQYHFSASDGELFFFFGLYLICFLDFFYGAGLLIRVLSKNKVMTYVFMFIFWFLSFSIIPEVTNIILQKKSQLLPANEKYNIIKLEEVMNFEREVQKAILGVKTLKERNEIYQRMVKKFLNTGYIKNSKIETDINRNIQTIVQEYEKTLLFYPTCFYNYLSGEVSGKGYQGYLELIRFTLRLRHDFVRYYLKKRYESNGTSAVLPFIKKDENIFYARSVLPDSFPIACGLTILYTLTFFIVSNVVLKKRSRKLPKIEKPRYKFRKGGMYFVLCKNEQFRDNLFRCYLENESTIGIDRVDAEELNPGLSALQMVRYFSKLIRVDEKKVWSNLKLLGLEGASTETWQHEKPGGKVPDEIVYKIYCAVSMAGAHKIIFVNDFLKRKPKEMEHRFLDLVTQQIATGRIVVYLSTEIFLTPLPFRGDIKINNYKSFKINPQGVSLR